ncbi:hypothetical protein CCP2SC5_60005 [Azospirillaceae bacterium]
MLKDEVQPFEETRRLFENSRRFLQLRIDVDRADRGVVADVAANRARRARTRSGVTTDADAAAARKRAAAERARTAEAAAEAAAGPCSSPCARATESIATRLAALIHAD